MREAGGFGESDVDGYHEVERRERLAHACAVCHRMGGVGALDQHRAKSLRMIGKDLIGNHVARREACRYRKFRPR
jgi:hypothetical protein